MVITKRKIMLQINGTTRTSALLQFQRKHNSLEVKIGTKAFNRVGWKHEHKDYQIIGEFSPGSATAKDRVVFAVYGRER